MSRTINVIHSTLGRTHRIDVRILDLGYRRIGMIGSVQDSNNAAPLRAFAKRAGLFDVFQRLPWAALADPITRDCIDGGIYGHTLQKCASTSMIWVTEASAITELEGLESSQ